MKVYKQFIKIKKASGVKNVTYFEARQDDGKVIKVYIDNLGDISSLPFKSRVTYEQKARLKYSRKFVFVETSDGYNREVYDVFTDEELGLTFTELYMVFTLKLTEQLFSDVLDYKITQEGCVLFCGTHYVLLTKDNMDLPQDASNEEVLQRAETLSKNSTL